MCCLVLKGYIKGTIFFVMVSVIVVLTAVLIEKDVFVGCSITCLDSTN
jgi:hypothetical protein